MAEVRISGVKRDVPFADVQERVNRYANANVSVNGLLLPRADQLHSSLFGRVRPDCQDIDVSLRCQNPEGFDQYQSGVRICGIVFMRQLGIDIPNIPEGCHGCPMNPQTTNSGIVV